MLTQYYYFFYFISSGAWVLLEHSGWFPELAEVYKCFGAFLGGWVFCKIVSVLLCSFALLPSTVNLKCCSVHASTSLLSKKHDLSYYDSYLTNRSFSVANG